jgi:hypothetical protein
MEEAQITQVRNTNVYGNPRGIGLLEDIAALKDRVAALEGDFTGLRRKVAALEGDSTGLRQKVAVLEKGCRGFRQIRGRYLDTYRRDVLRNLSPDGQARIKDGNLVAHDPDAVNDAYLFTSGSRTDAATIQELYGIELSEISLIGE